MAARDPLANPRELIERVYAYAAYRLRDGADAEEAASRTFERALRHRDRYDPERGEPIAWLLGIARRCVADVVAERYRELPVSEEELESEIADPCDLAGDVIRRVTLQASLNKLPERDHELIALRYGADLTARQIAELTDSRTNAIEVALHRSLTRLRSLLLEPAAPPSGLEEGAPASRMGAPRTRATPHPTIQA